jgi:hypothetical protein
MYAKSILVKLREFHREFERFKPRNDKIINFHLLIGKIGLVDGRIWNLQSDHGAHDKNG